MSYGCILNYLTDAPITLCKLLNNVDVLADPGLFFFLLSSTPIGGRFHSGGYTVLVQKGAENGSGDLVEELRLPSLVLQASLELLEKGSLSGEV